MDPNKMLGDIRRYARYIRVDGRAHEEGLSERFAELVGELDVWLSEGGVHPNEWRGKYDRLELAAKNVMEALEDRRGGIEAMCSCPHCRAARELRAVLPSPKRAVNGANG